MYIIYKDVGYCKIYCNTHGFHVIMASALQHKFLYLPRRKRCGQMRQMSPPADITSPPATPSRLLPPL